MREPSGIRESTSLNLAIDAVVAGRGEVELLAAHPEIDLSHPI
jgi:hypothetical protein